jgi:transposase
MASIPLTFPLVIGGAGTHKDPHVGAVVDAEDRVLGTASFCTTRAGYRALLAWMRTFGDVRRVGVEGTGSYGAGLPRHLEQSDLQVLEVDRPDRSDRRRRGKDDTLDAEMAAHAALAERRTVTPKSRTGMVESLRVLRVARCTAVKSRRVALQMLRSQIISAPEELRDQVRNLTRMRLIRTCAAWRPDETAFRDPVAATRIALKSLARRYLELDDEVADLDDMITPLVRELAPSLLGAVGFGIENTVQLLVTAGDNPDRCTSEAKFAKLCGVAPLPASSGPRQRHRLNRSGDRQANSALHLAVITRPRIEDRTRRYVERRTAEGKSKMEIIRCLKRYAALEAYYLIRQDAHHRAAAGRHTRGTAR